MRMHWRGIIAISVPKNNTSSQIVLTMASEIIYKNIIFQNKTYNSPHNVQYIHIIRDRFSCQLSVLPFCTSDQLQLPMEHRLLSCNKNIMLKENLVLNIYVYESLMYGGTLYQRIDTIFSQDIH